MTNDNPTPGPVQEFDLYGALLVLARSWVDSLDATDRDATTARKAFSAVAELAASEVLP